MNLNKLFLKYCKKNSLEVNPNQIDLIESLNLFYNLNFNKSLFKNLKEMKQFKIDKYFLKKTRNLVFTYKVMLE